LQGLDFVVFGFLGEKNVGEQISSLPASTCPGEEDGK